MAVDRPTFSESWYRVAGLRPRLRATVQVHRQYFRGRIWHVLQDPGSNQFFRLPEPASRFLGLLDGRRQVAEAWQIANQQLGDQTPTQNEVIQLLGQLYAANLLMAELAPDAEGLFERYRKRVRREVQGYLMNLLFVRIPLLDPDAFLERWVAVVGQLFTRAGLVLWLTLLVAGLWSVVDRLDVLADRASGVLDPANLPLLYASFVLIKVLHEFGHGFACKTFGCRSGSGGEVHVMGVMLLVFTPIPYVDASSAWALRSKWHRVVVGAAGMMVELAVAAVAAIVWARTADGTTVHAVAYNVMLIASVSTLLFNGNPLLRYDGYYILADLLEIPNLAQRSKEYLYYLVKRYPWGIRQAKSPAHSRSERAWLLSYAIASTIYRVVICVAILLFVADKLFVFGAILAVAALIAWLLVPLGRFLHYLATSGELARVRTRAVASTAATTALVLAGLGLVPAPDRHRIEGVIEPAEMAVVGAGADGFVHAFLPTGQLVEPQGPALLEAGSAELLARRAQLQGRRAELEARWRIAGTREPVAQQILSEQIQAIEDQIRRADQELAALSVHAPFPGTWIAPEAEDLAGAYLPRGQAVGLVASLDRLRIRATAKQDFAARLFAETVSRVEVRVKGRPDQRFEGTVERIIPAGQQELPSAALSYAAGGSMETKLDDREGHRSAERFFEVLITPNAPPSLRLLAGQRVVVRMTSPATPLLVQWWRRVLQVIQRRFHI